VCGAQQRPVLMYNYVSHRSQLELEDEDHAVCIRFRLVTTTLSSLRTTTWDALFVPSDKYPISTASSTLCLEQVEKSSYRTFNHFFMNLS